MAAIELAVDVRKKREHGKRREREVRAIGWRGLEHVKRNAPACARPVVDHRGVLGERATCEFFAHTARHDIARTAGRKAVKNLDLFDRQASLRKDMRPDGTQHGGGRTSLDQLTA